MTGKALLVFACGLFVGCAATQAPPGPSTALEAEAPEARALVEEALQATAVVATKRILQNGPGWYGCSGVFVQTRTGVAILTARHCTLSTIEGSPLLCFAPETQLIEQIMPSYLDSLRDRVLCTVQAVSVEADLVLLRPTYALPTQVRALPVRARGVERAEPVYGVASPDLAFNTWFEGYVNGRIRFLRLNMPEGFQPLGLFGYTTPVSGGASGAMVLNQEGELVGITLAGLYQTNTGIAVGTERIREVLAEHL